MGAPACSGGRVAGSGQRADKQADWLAGWLAWGGGCALGSPASRDRNALGCWLRKRLLGNLPLSLSPWASLSLHLTVFCSPQLVTALSGPSQWLCTSFQLSHRPPRRGPCPTTSLPACLWAPASAHLCLPPVDPYQMSVCVCLCAREACRATDPWGWDGSPCNWVLQGPAISDGRGGNLPPTWPCMRVWATTTSPAILSSDPERRKSVKTISLESGGFGSFSSWAAPTCPLPALGREEVSQALRKVLASLSFQRAELSSQNPEPDSLGIEFMSETLMGPSYG